MPYERQLDRFDFLILYTSSNKTSLRFWKLCVTVDIEGVLTSTHSKQNCFYWQPSTGELRYLEFQGNGENTSSFPKFEIANYDVTRIHVHEQKCVHFRLELS